MLHRLPLQPRVRRITKASRAVIPSVVEYAYYGLIFYGVMPFTQALQLRLLSGGAYAALAAFCVMRLGTRAIVPIAIPLACGSSLIALQILVHDASFMAVRPFIIWMLHLIIVQCLYLRRGFLHRFALAALVIGLLLLPYLDYGVPDGGVARAGLEWGAGLSNPNELGQWFGFLCVYMVIAGIEVKRTAVRTACWLVGAGCFYVVGLTVSRGTLLAIMIAIIVALRRLLKRGFIPTLSLLLLAWILYSTGVFEQLIASYASRATAETGRFLVWPLVIERFLNSPLAGVGLAEIGTYVPSAGPITPHNGFLFIALASGIIPLTFFVAYWWRTARRALRLSAVPNAYAAFSAPLWVFTFLCVQSSNGTFMEIWAVVALSMAMATKVPGQAPQIGGARPVQHLRRLREGSYRTAKPQRFIRRARF